MILAEAIAIGLVLSLLTGGSIRLLAREPLKGEAALLLLLPLQLLWPRIAAQVGLPCALSTIVWLFLMASLAVVLFLNVSRRWMLALAGLGIAMNVLVIGINSAMPVSIRATSEIGVPRAEARAVLAADCLHEEMTEDTRLALLGDFIAVSGPQWQRGVISAGDILLAIGLAAWVFAASRGHEQSDRTHAWRPA